MYFIALLLTLCASPVAVPSPDEEGQLLCEAVVASLKQSVDAHALPLIRAIVLSCTWPCMTLRVTIGEQVKPSGAPISLRSLLSWSTLQTTQRAYTIEAIDLTNSSWSAIATWHDLLEHRTSPVVRFSLATPLLLADQQQMPLTSASAFPVPQTLFARLMLRWKNLGGPEWSQDSEQVMERSRCVVSGYCLRSVSVHRAGQDYLCYRGWIEYVCLLSHDEAIRALNALARLAFFTGLGALTECGLGETAVAFHRTGAR